MPIEAMQERARLYINNLRDAQGITVARLAEMTDIPKATLDNFLGGSTKSPNFANVCAVIRALGGSVDVAIGLREAPSSAPIQIAVDNGDLLRAHQEALDLYNARLNDLSAAHDAVLAEKDGRIQRLERQVKALTRWHRFFLVENVCLLVVMVADVFSPTWGYFRDIVSRFTPKISNHFFG